MKIEAEQLWQELDTLAGFSDVPLPAVTRMVFSDADLRAREYVKGLCGAAGLVIREDAVGNLFARWVGQEPQLGAIGTGSHMDAIPHSGRFDGTVGVLGGLEAIRALQREGVKPRRSIELLLFTSEEPTRFGIGCLGSRLLSGSLDASAGTSLKDNENRTLDMVREDAGFQGDLSEVRLSSDYYAGFVELHIEQGPLLERDLISLGVVTAIAAPASLRITIEGEGGHAGAVLMPQRRDSFCAAAEVVLAVERAAKGTGVVDTVGTVGVCEIFPSAVNSIPSRVRLEVDIRDIDEARRDAVIEEVRFVCDEVAHRRKVGIGIEVLNADAPAISSPRIVEALEQAAVKHGLSYQRMVSRAYHDSLFMSRIAPTAMLFIPCRNGVSHRPDEWASKEAIAEGVLVLAETLHQLAEADSPDE